jgi:hypothetical protein
LNNVTEAASANVDHDAVQEDGIVPSVPRLGWPGRMVGEHHRVDDVAVGDVHGPHDVAAPIDVDRDLGLAHIDL